MKNKSKRISIVVSMMLVVTMLFGTGSVLASETIADENAGFTIVATAKEKLENDVVLVKTLSMPQAASRTGFSGATAAHVQHTYYKQGKEVMSISAVASFTSKLGVNCCYLANPHYTILKESRPYYNFGNISEKTWNNEGMGILNRYAKYEVSYDPNGNFPGLTGNRKSMWVKCESNYKTSTSGDKVYKSVRKTNSSIDTNKNAEFIQNNIRYTFG